MDPEVHKQIYNYLDKGMYPNWSYSIQNKTFTRRNFKRMASSFKIGQDKKVYRILHKVTDFN